MPFDTEMVLHDGTTITLDITPTSTSRTSGSAVLNIKKTGSNGLVAVLIMGADLAEASDTFIVTIEESATANGTYVELARFPTLTKGTGMPGTYMRRFTTDKAYIRALIDINDDDGGADFTVADCYILLSQYPFVDL